MRFQRLGYSSIVVAAFLPVADAQAQVYRSPQHDLRMMIALDKTQNIVRSFYDVYYGDTIRLGEFGCGDPRFLVHVNEVPKFTAAGWLGQDGSYGTQVSLFTGVNAKIYEQCFFLDQPSVGGTGRIGASLSRVSELSDLELKGSFSIGALAEVLGITFPFSKKVALPLKPNAFPIDLGSANGVDLEFGEFKGGVWETACPKKQKNIPIVINVGSFGELGVFAHDGSSRGDAFLVTDVSIGAQPRYREYAGPNARKEQEADFREDSPLSSAEPARGVGISLADSFFGEASSGGSSSGFLGELLPIRVRGETEYTLFCRKRRIRYEVVLSEASVEFDPNSPANSPAINVRFGAGYAAVRDVSTVAGRTILGPAQLVRKVVARARFDQFGYDPATSSFRFRVSYFGVDLQVRKALVPIKLSAGGLEKALNGGVIRLATIDLRVPMELPPCIWIGYEKFKSRNNFCQEYGPGQVIGALSYEPEISPVRSRALRVLTDTLRLARVSRRIQLTAETREEP